VYAKCSSVIAQLLADCLSCEKPAVRSLALLALFSVGSILWFFRHLTLRQCNCHRQPCRNASGQGPEQLRARASTMHYASRLFWKNPLPNYTSCGTLWNQCKIIMHGVCSVRLCSVQCRRHLHEDRGINSLQVQTNFVSLQDVNVMYRF